LFGLFGYLVERKKPDEPNQQNKPKQPNEPNKPGRPMRRWAAAIPVLIRFVMNDASRTEGC
jgi:H+/gluconate symporter-like permease